MKSSRLSFAFLLTLLVSACVTINVYFPAAAAEKAADKVIEKVYGGSGAEQPKPAPQAAPAPQSRIDGPGAVLGLLLTRLVPAAYADVNFTTSSPGAQRLIAAMAARFPSLRPYFQSGAVGMTRDGLLAVRDLNAVPLPQRRQVQQLVAQENADRNALYAEVARANGHPDWEKEIRATFARRWVANAAGGWWYQDTGGAWRRK